MLRQISLVIILFKITVLVLTGCDNRPDGASAFDVDQIKGTYIIDFETREFETEDIWGDIGVGLLRFIFDGEFYFNGSGSGYIRIDLIFFHETMDFIYRQEGNKLILDLANGHQEVLTVHQVANDYNLLKMEPSDEENITMLFRKIN